MVTFWLVYSIGVALFLTGYFCLLLDSRSRHRWAMRFLESFEQLVLRIGTADPSEFLFTPQSRWRFSIAAVLRQIPDTLDEQTSFEARKLIEDHFFNECTAHAALRRLVDDVIHPKARREEIAELAIHLEFMRQLSVLVHRWNSMLSFFKTATMWSYFQTLRKIELRTLRELAGLARQLRDSDFQIRRKQLGDDRLESSQKRIRRNLPLVSKLQKFNLLCETALGESGFSGN